MELQLGLNGHVFETGYAVLEERGTAIVGMSPGNSYFKQKQIRELLQEVSHRFAHIKIMIADQPAIHTYRALGYSRIEAERKARLNGNQLQNYSHRSIEQITAENPAAHIELIEWKDKIDPHPAYQMGYLRVLDLYRNNATFRKDARDTTKKVIQPKLKPSIELENAIDQGVQYLLQELGFIIAGPEMFGVPQLTYVYHDRWPVFENLVNGMYDDEVRNGVGSVVIQ